MHEDKSQPLWGLLLIVACCGVPLLALALASGAMAVIVASLRVAFWPLLIALAIVALSVSGACEAGVRIEPVVADIGIGLIGGYIGTKLMEPVSVRRRSTP